MSVADNCDKRLHSVKTVELFPSCLFFDSDKLDVLCRPRLFWPVFLNTKAADYVL